MNILIVKFGALGDVVRTAYILPGLHRKYAGARIYWLTAPSSVDLLRHNPHVFRIINPKDLEDTASAICFDLVISLDEELEILSLLEMVSHKELVGASLCHGRPFYGERCGEWFDMGLISRFGKERADDLKKSNGRQHNDIFATMLGISIDEGSFYNDPAIEEQMAKGFSADFFNVGLNSGAGTRWQAKQLPLPETITLIERLLDRQVSGKRVCIHLFGGVEERERNHLIKQAVRSDRLIDTGDDNTLLQFAALIKGCDYIITSDSLALHLTISQQVPNLSFFAPTSAAEIGTFGTGVKLISLADDYCSYRPDADNSTITAERILTLFDSHLATITSQGGKH